MQTAIVALIVLVCLAALVRSIWRQFTSQGAAGCGGCAAAKGCGAQKASACANSAVGPAASPVHWQRRPGASE